MSGRSRLSAYKKSGRNDENMRRKRASQMQERRTASRADDFAKRRGLEEDSIETIVVDRTRLKLEEWKKNKEQKLSETKRKTRPAFKVGAVKHNDNYLYRPVGESKKFNPPSSVKPMEVLQPVRRVLRSASKSKQQASARSKTVARAVKEFAAALTCIPEEGGEANVSVLNRTFDKEPEESVMTNGAINVLDMPADIHTDSTVGPAMAISTTVAGAEKTVANTAPASQDQSVLFADHVSSAQSKDAEHYRALHITTVAGLEVLCDEWMLMQQHQQLPPNVQDQVDVAIGYAKLLIKEKLQQFGSLIRDHLNENIKPPVLLEDLEGFWHLVDIQVQDIHKKFSDLNKIRINGWKEPEPEIKLIQQKKPKRKVLGASNTKSNARAFIALARKQMKGEGSEVSSPKPMSPAVMRVSLMAKNIASPKTLSPPSKTADAGSARGVRKVEKENANPQQTPIKITGIQAKRTLQTNESTFITPRRSRQIVKGATPSSAVRRSTRLLTKSTGTPSHLL